MSAERAGLVLVASAMNRTTKRNAVLTVVACLAAACAADEGSTAEVEPVDDPSPTTTVPIARDADPDDADPDDAAGSAASASSLPVSDPAPATAAGRCEPAEAPGRIALTLWHRLDGDATGYLDGLVAEYERLHPDVSITVELIEADDSAALGQLAETGDDGPDILMGTNRMVRAQADSGRFVPIIECTAGEVPDSMQDLLPTIERTYTVDGVLWAAPFNVSSPVMLYNGDQWRAAGLDPGDPPETFDELIDVIHQLHASDQLASGAVLYGQSAMWLVEQLAVKRERLLIEPANGREGGVADAVRFADDETVALLTEFHDLYDEGAVHWIGDNPTGSEDLVRVIHPSEPTGLTFNTSAVLGDVFRLVDAGAVADIDVRAAPFPGPAPGTIAGGSAWWLVDSGDSARVAAAWHFVDWLTQPERIAEFAAYTGYIPTTETAAALPATLESWSTYPPLRVAYGQVRSGPDSDARAGIQIGPMIEVHRQLEVAAANAIESGSDPAELLENAQTNALGLIEVYLEARPTGP